MDLEHIAFIMDGNGRWAKQRNKKRTAGHKKGSETLKQVCQDCHQIGIKYVTVYAFSTENWQRPAEEVGYLINLLKTYLKDSVKTAAQNNMRVRIIGDRMGLEAEIQQLIEQLEQESAGNNGLNLTIALNYGARDEIIRSFNKFLAMPRPPKQITAQDFEAHLDTAGIPEPDLLIRTSGEQRLSNFLLWQLAYAEFYFTEVFWPDFDKAELLKAIDYYHTRQRRFGGIIDEN